jgi:hypothetical protein
MLKDGESQRENKKIEGKVQTIRKFCKNKRCR